MKKLFLVLTVVLIALVGCAPPPARPNPEAVLVAMEEALNAGDVDAAMAPFTADAVVKLVPALPPSSPDTYTGAQEIRGWFEELVAMNFEMDIEVLQVEGDTVTTRTKTWVDATRETGVAPLVATEVYTVQDGKIKGFTWTISDESLAKIQAAMAVAQALALVQAFIDAQNAGDVDAALDLMTDDAVIQLVPPPMEGHDGVFTGKDEIREWWEGLTALHGAGEISNVQVDGDRVTALLTYTDDSIKALGIDAIDNDWVVTLRDGKIQSYTATMTEESLAEMMAAMAAPLEEAILGMWSWDLGVTYFQFSEDGTYRYDVNFDRLGVNPADIGQYSIEGNILTFVSNKEAWVCEPGSTGRYEIAITEEGKLEFVKLEDDCVPGRSAPSMNPQPFTRVSPTSVPPTPTPEATATPEPETVEVTVTKLEDIVGVWKGDDMGALQFKADGTTLVSESLAGLTDASHGGFWFEGSLLKFADADGSGEGSYSVRLTKQGDKAVSLTFRAVKDPFADRRAILTQRVWYWVEP